jgi:hypothetical protein
MKKLRGLATIKYLPETIGLKTFKVYFNHNQEEIFFEKTIVVLKNTHPQITSEVSADKVKLDQKFHYLLSYKDDDSDSVDVHISADPKYWSMNSDSLILNTSSPGVYHAKIHLEDGYGGFDDQWVQVEVAKQMGTPYQYSLENLRLNTASLWDLEYRSGTSRVGLLSTNLSEHFGSGSNFSQYNPFLYFGGSFLGENKMREGDYLFFDVGLSFRALGKTIYGGGVMTRLQGQWYYANKIKSKFTWLAYVKQALLVITSTEETLIEVQEDIENTCTQTTGGSPLDSANYNQCRYDIFKSAAIIQQKCGTLPEFDFGNISPDDAAEFTEQEFARFQSADCQDLLFTFGLEEGFKDVWNDYTQPNNVLSFVELETLYTPTNWLEMGPIFWREDQAVVKAFSQYFGLSTYLKWNWKGLAASVNWKMGWGVNSNYQTTQINPITQELKTNGKEEPVTVNDWVNMIEMKVLFNYISND